MRCLPMLDDIEQRSDAPWTRPSRTGGAWAEGTGPLDLPLSGDGCWCGGPLWHDWPGRDAGAPHPRSTS